MCRKSVDEITYPFPNFNGAAIEVWKWISNFIPQFTGHAIDYLSMLRLKLNHVSERGTTKCNKVNFVHNYWDVFHTVSMRYIDIYMYNSGL